MPKNRTLWAIAFALAVAAHAPAQKSKQPRADFFPLRTGDSWTYRNTADDSRYTLKVLSEEKQEDGSTRYLVEMLAGVQIHKSFSKPGGWVLLHGERYPEHEGLEAKYEPAKQFLQNPLVPGFKWRWQGKDQTQTEVGENNKVVKFENVIVPAGKFRAMKLVSEVSGGPRLMIRTSWYANGVGLVKTVTEAGQIKYGSELVDYSFKKPDKK